MNKKAILCVCVVMAIAVVITLITVSEKSNIGNPVNEKIEIDESLYNNGNVAAEGMEPINKNIVLGNISDIKLLEKNRGLFLPSCRKT